MIRSVYFQTFILSFTIQLFLFFVSWLKGVILHWPDAQILASAFYLKGWLAHDLVGQSVHHSPLFFSASLFASALSDNHIIALSSFIILQIFTAAFAYWISGLALVRAWGFMVSQQDVMPKSTLASKETTYFYLTIMALPVIIYAQKIDIFWPWIHLFFIPASVGLWQFPLHASANHSGISFILAMISFVIYRHIVFDATKKGLASLSALLTLSATLIHPIVGLVPLSLYFGLFCLVRPQPFWRGLVRVSLTLGVPVILGWSFIILYFANISGFEPLSPNAFFDIYIAARHPHHYLPSHYIDHSSIPLMLSSLSLFVLAAFAGAKQHRRQNIIAASIVLILLLAIHSIQYFGVEILRNLPLSKLGISRLSTIYNFFYLLLILYFLSPLISWVMQQLTVRVPLIFRLAAPKFITVSFVFLSIACLAMTGFLYQATKSAIPQLPDYRIGQFLHKTTQEDSPLIINDTSLSYLREFGRLSVYVDDYFPFSENHMAIWSERVSLQKTFIDCLAKKRSLSSCRQAVDRLENGYLVSEKRLLEEPLLKIPFSSEYDIYVYKLTGLPDTD